MNPFIWTLIWNLIISIWIISTIFIARFFKNKLLPYINYITALTVWLLLWIIFLWFIPELIDSQMKWIILWTSILVGLFLFYILELFLHWHHCHDLSHKKHDCHHTSLHKNKNWILIFGSTFLHNAFHWIVLFGAFWINLTFGVSTTIAILLHSIPQNIVNYIMNYKTEKYSFAAAFWWIIWVLLIYPFSTVLLANKFIILSIITWGLLYTALADIFPEFKEKWWTKTKISYLFFILLWILVYILFNHVIVTQ